MGKNSKSITVTPLMCPHCAGPLSKEMETTGWTVPPLVRDSFSMIGSAVGGTTSAFYGFNYVMPTVRKWIKGPMWLHFLIGVVQSQPWLNSHLHHIMLQGCLQQYHILLRKTSHISQGPPPLCSHS
uniref:Uncharacterized protein n=1 Tax=Opuntia streptacantha TaxID=393608 RepID=A0A7C9AUR2_OPUST